MSAQTLSCDTCNRQGIEMDQLTCPGCGGHELRREPGAMVAAPVAARVGAGLHDGECGCDDCEMARDDERQERWERAHKEREG
jgi:hypothetical protein